MLEPLLVYNIYIYFSVKMAIYKYYLSAQVISDLLKPDRTNLSIREDKRRGVFVEGITLYGGFICRMLRDACLWLGGMV